MKDGDYARIASLAQTRDKLVKLRTTLKNKVNNLLSARGILLGKEKLSSEKGLEGVLSAPVSELEKMELEVLVEEIRHLNTSIQKVEEILREQGPKLPGWKNINSIKGIGGTGASILLSTIGNIHDFADEGKLSSYFGIVPRVSNSNDTQHSGRITKQGCKLGRTLSGTGRFALSLVHSRPGRPYRYGPLYGRGHFSREAFDMLAAMYREQHPQMAPAEIANRILSHHLYGIDIDPRCAQLAALTLYLRAQELAQDGRGGYAGSLPPASDQPGHHPFRADPWCVGATSAPAPGGPLFPAAVERNL